MLWISKILNHFSTQLYVHEYVWFVHINYLVYDLLYYLSNSNKKFVPTQFRIEIWRQSKIKSILVRFPIWHNMISDCEKANTSEHWQIIEIAYVEMHFNNKIICHYQTFCMVIWWILIEYLVRYTFMNIYVYPYIMNVHYEAINSIWRRCLLFIISISTFLLLQS